MTSVVNIRKIPGNFFTDSGFQYVGRAGRGFDGYFGNPLGTLDGYAEWLLDRVTTDLIFRERLKSLSGKTLVCFCKPKPCHGDLLADFADALAQGTLEPLL